MENLNLKKIKGYIEGYYGKILTWEQRFDMINCLARNDMNFYFYCPKEDIFHRKKWRVNYPDSWIKSFKSFCNNAKKNNVNVIAGISPGLDFDFRSYSCGDKKELNSLIKKSNFFLDNGANFIAILLDDIPNNFSQKFNLKNEGKYHAKLVNDVSINLKENVFTVPRIYSDELIHESRSYLNEFFKNLNNNINIFYCGENIVSKSFKTNLKSVQNKILENKIVYWDNFYANDYCPKKFFVGPYMNKKLESKTMINGTGMIGTDKLILDIVKKTQKNRNHLHIWKNILKKNKIPKQFNKICKPFLSPNFNKDKKLVSYKFDKYTFDCLDFLLWEWKSSLSREWYPYLLIFKQELQILNQELSFNRILKTQTIPLQNKLINRSTFK